MVERTIFDLLNTNIDSNEIKILNATTVSSFKSISPSGEIIFDSAEAVIPGTLNTTASLAATASFINGGSF